LCAMEEQLLDAAASTTEQGELWELTEEMMGLGLAAPRLGFFKPGVFFTRFMEIGLDGSGRREPSTSAAPIWFPPS
jgi:hypothetical protein